MGDEPARPRDDPSGDVLDAVMVAEFHALATDGEGARRVRELIATYLASCHQRIDRLQDAIDRGDADETARLAHSLRGSSLNFGAVVVARIAEAIESVEGTDDIGRASDHLPRLRTAAAAADIALRAAFGLAT